MDKLYYRCPFCGEDFEKDIDNAKQMLGRISNPIDLHILHDCGMGRMGVAQLIGGASGEAVGDDATTAARPEDDVGVSAKPGFAIPPGMEGQITEEAADE